MSKAPEFYQDAKTKYPDFFERYEALSNAARTVGPLDEKTVALVKLGLAIGAGLEGATHSSTRKAKAAGCTDEEIEHAALLSVTSVGFPAMMRARAWIGDLLNAD